MKSNIEQPPSRPFAPRWGFNLHVRPKVNLSFKPIIYQIASDK